MKDDDVSEWGIVIVILIFVVLFIAAVHGSLGLYL